MSDEKEPDLPQVGMVVENEDGRWKVLRSIATGPFSDVFIVSELGDNRKKYAMKVEKQNGNIRAVLKLDVMVLADMQKRLTPGFPEKVTTGRTPAYKYLVMQLLGPDIGKLRRSLPEKRPVWRGRGGGGRCYRFSLQTALKISLQVLDRLEALHEAGWLCRDVKGPNLVIGSTLNGEPDHGTIYMLDFGFARRYKDKHGNFVAPRSQAALVGTFQYAPLAAHAHKEQSPKDDMESWLYTAVELMKGPLPWGGYKDYHHMGDYKKAIREEKREFFFDGVPEEMAEIMDSIDRTQFFEAPDYDEYRRMLKNVARRTDVDLDGIFDWQIHPWMLRRAAFVGDLGESNMASSKAANAADSDSSDDRSSLPVDVTPPMEVKTPPIHC